MKTVLDRLPEIFLQESRDFQLFARLWNMLFLRKHFKAKSILQILDPMTCPERYLDDLRDRLGFEPMIDIEPSKLRVILKVFPYLIRRKGSMRAVKTAVRVALLLEGKDSRRFDVFINKREGVIEIFIDEVFDTAILEEIFRHIAPIGFSFTVTATKFEEKFTTISADSVVFMGRTTPQKLSSVGNQEYFEWGADEYNDDGEVTGLRIGEQSIEGEDLEKVLKEWAVGSIGIQEVVATRDIEDFDEEEDFESMVEEEDDDIDFREYGEEDESDS